MKTSEILESLSSPYQLTMQTDGWSTQYKFLANNGSSTYITSFIPDEINSSQSDKMADDRLTAFRFEVSLAPTKPDIEYRFDVTGTGDAQRVMATMISALIRFINVRQPTCVWFAADKDEQSRVKLYRRILNRLSLPKNYRIVTNDLPDWITIDDPALASSHELYAILKT